MGLFGDIKKQGKKILNKNFLEAVISAALYVAHADGDCDKDELA